MTREISLKIENELIVFAELINHFELILICESGNVYHSNTQTATNRLIRKLEFPVKYDEATLASIGKINDFLQVHFYRNYVCTVQKYGQNGVVFNLENSEYKKILYRKDYQIEHCIFPISFYEKDNQTFLIHGTDWNRLDITCLETDELLTDRIVDYDTNSNYFDYFHSSLLVSPDARYFTSNGWFWQPCDVITVYPIDEFLQKFELSNAQLNFGDVDGYNWDRPLCWIDNKTLGIGYNQKEANEGQGNFISEVLFVDILQNKVISRIDFDGFTISQDGAAEGTLFYDQENKHLLGLNSQSGLLISDINGKEIIKEPSFTSHKYSPKDKLLYQIDLENQLLKTFEIKLP